MLRVLRNAKINISLPKEQSHIHRLAAYGIIGDTSTKERGVIACL
jgi:hypothetical protein